MSRVKDALVQIRETKAYQVFRDKMAYPGLALLNAFSKKLTRMTDRFARQSQPGDAAQTMDVESTATAMTVRYTESELYDAFRKTGYFCLKEHFYHPLPDFNDLTDEFLASRSELVGIHMPEADMWTLAEETLTPYNKEFRMFPEQSPSTGYKGFCLINGGYMAVDGNLYYGLVRHLKPGRIIETGCGMSSLLCSEALAANEAEGHATRYICIEPYPQPYLSDNPKLKVSRFVEEKIQQVPLSLFEELEAGDILFIDTSHALRMGGDVQRIYCEILPRLKPGVYVHIHDISLPLQYPRVYHEVSHYFWNEQYLLQAYLANNTHTRVVWAGNWLRLQDETRFLKVFPEFATMRRHFPSSEPSAFWFVTQ
jgi:hypothetical protein